ncbi:MAG: threonine-phosphate decarboxylase CobD [Alcanivorax sediminis]|uniref:threonine-phosphate decarboxylase CobD n=1 Tax=Alcanivorax sediminis TaxID=2663008 RepID=UPI003C409F6A
MQANNQHGGRLNVAVRRWGIPRHDWLDLSTGISPWSWPVPPVPEAVWQRLPEEDDGLMTRCRSVFSLPEEVGCLPVPGSQMALQNLPRLRSPCRVGVPAPGYAEHALAWSRYGHQVVALAESEVDAALDSLDVLVCINPNNPTGTLIAAETLLRWHDQLSRRGGWLVVDEAFLDASEGASVAAHCNRRGLLVLRSLGKFYGLAGLRAGLLLGQPALCEQMHELLGPWAISHPARYLMGAALADKDWQQMQKARLRQARQRLTVLLAEAGMPPLGVCDLFAWCPLPEASRRMAILARQGILVREFMQPAALRIGLPASEDDWQRLSHALS